MSQWTMAEYWCDPCRWRGESLETKPAPELSVCGSCGGPAERVISAPRARVATVKVQPVSRGKSDPLPPKALDTRALADGMPIQEFKRKRSELWRNERFKQNLREAT